jgi:hypothetical protein
VGFVKCAIIEQKKMEAEGIGGGKMVEEELKALSIEGGQFEKETLPGQGFNRPIQVETLEAIGGWEKRLEAPGRNAAALDGQQSTATFVLHPQAPPRIAVLLRGRYARVELRAERGLELYGVLWLFFGCERRGALSLALSL